MCRNFSLVDSSHCRTRIICSIDLAVLPYRLVPTKARKRADHRETMVLFVVIYTIVF